MPMSNYNGQFGGKGGAASEAHGNMVREYGKGKGDSVFYALINKRKKAQSQSQHVGGNRMTPTTPTVRTPTPAAVAHDNIRGGIDKGTGPMDEGYGN